MYLLRLDDASLHMNLVNWQRMETLLDQYSIKPVFGIIPHNQDEMLTAYEEVPDFWKMMRSWTDKGWIPALHGYNHVYETASGGINPVNSFSEFAGVPLERQCQKIHDGYAILRQNGICPAIFFAPGHTFDRNTLLALERESQINVILDTAANDVYYRDHFYFVPQQSGKVRKLPMKGVTFCYHPNAMTDADFDRLEAFLSANAGRFSVFSQGMLKERKKGVLDYLIHMLYFARRR